MATPIDLDAFRAFLTGESYADGNVGPWAPAQYDPARRQYGEDWPATAFTMIGATRLRHLQECVDVVLREGIAGDLIECGVWRGGAVMLMRAVLNARGATDRTVWAADSFAGLPVGECPQDAQDEHHLWPVLSVSLEQVQANFRTASERIGQDLATGTRFLKGWFKDTLPGAPIDRLAVLRLDGDMYGSTMDCLTSLYPKLSPGGFVIIDDWCLKSARDAVGDYAAAHGHSFDVKPIDRLSAYFRKAGAAAQVAA